MGYEIWHAAPHGYLAEAYPQFGNIINSRAYFDTYDEAKEHAEREIDGYLDDTHSSHYDDALDPLTSLKDDELDYFGFNESAYDDPVREKAERKFDLLDNINTLDQYFLDLSPGDPAQREWEIYTEDLFYDYSGDGDSGFREVYWDDIDAIDVNEAILFAYDLAERHNKNDIPNIYRS